MILLGIPTFEILLFHHLNFVNFSVSQSAACQISVSLGSKHTMLSNVRYFQMFSMLSNVRYNLIFRRQRFSFKAHNVIKCPLYLEFKKTVIFFFSELVQAINSDDSKLWSSQVTEEKIPPIFKFLSGFIFPVFILVCSGDDIYFWSSQRIQGKKFLSDQGKFWTSQEIDYWSALR